MKEKYSLLLLDHTYLSNPSRLIQIIKNDINEDYVHLEMSDLKNLSKDNHKIFKNNFSKNDEK